MKSGPTDEQLVAMKNAIQLGRTLQKDHPEIAELYRQGNSIAQIGNFLRVELEYQVNYSVAWSGIQRAISGHQGGLKVRAYMGLIEEDERRTLAKEHNRESSKRLCEDKKGVFSRTPDQVRKDSQRAGKISYWGEKGLRNMAKEKRKKVSQKAGRKIYEEKLGIHGLSPEETRANAEKGALARGCSLWTEKETIDAYNLLQQADCQDKDGRPDLRKIGQGLVGLGYSKRTPIAIKSRVRKYRKSLEDKL